MPLKNIDNKKDGGTITINGKTYKGNSIIIKNNEISIDGKKIDNTETTKVNGCKRILKLLNIFLFNFFNRFIKRY
jgi:hypothetical protein